MNNFILKIFKWSMSILRLMKYKILYGKRIVFSIKNIKKLPYIGKNVEITLKNDSVLALGERVYIDNYTRIESLNNARITIDNFSFINTNCRIISMKDIYIGEHVLFGSNVSVYDHDHKIEDSSICTSAFTIDRVRINNNVWLCSNVVVTKGVHINSNITVGANSVVTKSLIEAGIYGGLPARFIKR